MNLHIRRGNGWALLPATLLLLAWLAPNHYFPWSAFHSDWLVAMGLATCVIGLLMASRGTQEVPWLAIGTLAVSAVPVFQWTAGMIHFAGDAWIASLYLLGFGFAIYAGSAAQRAGANWADLFAWTTLLGALISVMLALCQWLNVGYLSVFLADLPPGGRPFANLAQPNQLATLLMLGMVGAHALYQRLRIGAVVLGTTTCMLCLGLAMTQSRVAWLQMVAFLLWMTVRGRRLRLRAVPAQLVATGALFAALVFVWPSLCEALYLAPGRTLGEQAHSGLRLLHWASLVDAIGREPWLGYGWNQVSVAQSRVALDHPATREMLEHSHNVLLDLMVWNGLPLGFLIAGAMLWRFLRSLRDTADPTMAVLISAIGVVYIHAAVEFPLEYAYFLLPLGFLIGGTEAASHRRPATLKMPRWIVAMCTVATAGLFLWTTVEYIEIEENHRLLRFEAARIGHARIESQAPDVAMLTQLREYLQFARVEAREGMTPSELEWMRKVAERHGYPPVLFRYALASGINDRPEVAEEALARLCKLHSRIRCIEGLDAWALMGGERYPQLKAVTLPARP